MNNYTDEVTDFITSRFPTDCQWTSGNCYYFALILFERFRNCSPEIYYDVLEGHFTCKIGVHHYDWEGIIKYSDEYAGKYVKKWSEFADYDELQFNRIIRDVIM